MRRRRKLIFGCGYLGSRVARRWLASGDEVVAITRQREKAAGLISLGIVPVIADVTDAASLDGLPPADTVLYAVGYDRDSARTIEEVYAGGVRKVLATLTDDPQCFVYISTTGVYGEAGGQWIDEQMPPEPRREGGKASLAAEEVLRTSPIARQAVILRMAGLYGPGRIPYLEKLRAGEPIPAPQEGWLNLIHVDDAATAVLAAETRMLHEPTNGPWIVNVADGEPVVRREYYREIARRIGAPVPHFAPPDPASHRAARASSSRRISSAVLLRMLEQDLAYPNYRDGLQAILQGEEHVHREAR